MNRGSPDRIPVSWLILLASIFFTVMTFAIFKVLWEIKIPLYLLAAVVGLQLATLLLGSSKILTPLGAASLSALIGVCAVTSAVFLLFPPLIELRIAGAVGSISALVFIMASFVAASRQDSLPVQAPEPLTLDISEDIDAAELVKYGEVRGPENDSRQDVPLLDTNWQSELDESPAKDGTQDPTGHLRPTDPLGGETAIKEPVSGNESPLSDLTKPAMGSHAATVDDQSDQAGLRAPGTLTDPISPTTQSDKLNDDPPAFRPHDSSGTSKPGISSGGITSGSVAETKQAEPGDPRLFDMRTRYKILDAQSGTHYGTCFGDEGYSTLDTDTIAGLISDLPEGGLVRIVRLDWSNFDEVEVHIQVDEVPAGKTEKEAGDPSVVLEPGPEAGKHEAERIIIAHTEASLSDKKIQIDAGEQKVPDSGHAGNSYVIYDRRTMQPMGEFVPEGKRSRLDRLSLYRLFPEYNFKTFEIDSIRWESDEVRVFIRGEKKKRPEPETRNPEDKVGKEKLTVKE